MHSAHSSASSRRATLDDPNHHTNTNNNDYYSAYSSYNSNPYHEPHSRSRSSVQAFPAQVPSSPKRRSVFSARSRNTSTSSHRSPPTTAAEPAPCQDVPAYHPPLRTERQDSLTKSLLNRGSRILRRQGSKFSISATLDEVDEEREKPRFDVTDLFGRRSRQSGTSMLPYSLYYSYPVCLSNVLGDNLKRLISDPYDFHHLTHTSSSHVQSLQRTRENDLVSEFSAIRASQKPDTSLKGIRADDLHFPDLPRCSTPGVASAGDDEHAYAISASPPVSPGAYSSISPKQMPQRESRVCENFSRPVSRYPRTGSDSSIVSMPPQKPTLASSPVLESEAVQPSTVEPSRKVSLSQVNLTALFESGASLDLEDVPEETPTPGAETATHWHDSPEAQPEPPSLAPPICVAENLSRRFSEALASPTIPQYRLHQSDKPEVKSEDGPKVQTSDDTIYDSWDADIDYCYEHAAESTSNFDWSRRSFEDQHPTIEEEPEQPSIHLSTSSLFCPDLDPSPSRSVPSTQMLATPTTAYDEYFQGPMLPLTEGKQIQEPLYDEFSEQDRHLSLCSQGVIQAPIDQVSPRSSSFSPISNYNSQESLILSRAASLVRKHRSSISATSSIPELVNSLSSHETMPESFHRPTKSLEMGQILGAAGSTGDHPEESSHDRTKSTSDIYKELPPLPSVKGHKRAAYSLFPGQ